MKLFELRANYDDCCSFLFKTATGDGMLGDDWFEGTARAGNYPVIRGCRNDENRTGPLPDFTHLGLRPFPLFSERSINALGEMLNAHGEFAAVEMNEPMRYCLFNATTVVDYLDEQRSKILRFQSSNRIWRVEQHVLKASVQELPPIFKMTPTRVGQTYVSEEFVNLVQDKRLLGFQLDLLFEK